MVLVGWSHRAVTDGDAPTNRTACSETSLKHRSRRTNSQTAALSGAPGVCSPSLLAPRHRGRLQTVTCHARTVSAASAPCGHSETLGMSWSWDCGHVRGSRECPGASAASKRDAATREGPLGPLCRRIRISVASGLSRGDRLSDGAVSKAGTHRLATRPWTEQVAEPGASVPPHVVGGARLSLLRSPGSDTMCCCDTAEVDRGL